MRYVAACFGLFLISPTCLADEVFAQTLFDHWKAKHAIPHFTEMVKEPTMKSAYATQFRYVRKRLATDKITGFKAGLTSAAGQEKFSVNQALSGVLFSSGRHTQDRPLFLSDYGKLMIETEIGFRVAKPINAPISSVEKLKTFFKAAMPIIELPDLGFQNPAKITGVDIVAANVAASSFIVGVETPMNQLPNINLIEITLSNNQQIINRGKGSDALTNQWQALLWLVNQLLSEGYQIQPNHILITGAIGKMLPARLGLYHANFGGLGSMQFIVES